MRENEYQEKLIKDMRRRWRGLGVIILKNDSSYLQGVSDLTIIFEKRWAWLEVKAYANATRQPNQEYYVDWANQFWFGSFIYPEIEEEVLNDLEQALGIGRPARFLKC